MYTEEPRREINWGNLIKKSLIVIIVVLLLFIIFWLLIKNNSTKTNVNVNSNGDQYQNSTLHESYYTSDFIENYRYFHDTAKEYFLVNELPSEGRTIKYTLQELINKGLILPFGYNNQACDLEASYVLVTNVNGDYKLTVTLVCGTEVGKTTEDLGCNQLCNNGSCQVTPDEPQEPSVPSTDDKVYKTEYEYKQAYVESVVNYVCPNGYTKDGNLCYKNNNTTVKATKNVTYTCESGYDKVGEGANTKCVKSGSKSVDAKATTTYTCESGYDKVGEGANTKCVKSGSKSVDAKATTTYTCDTANGYIAVGSGSSTKCYKKTNLSMPAASIESYGCPSGYTQVGYGINSTCVKTISNSYKAVTQNYEAGCPSGYSREGNSCVKYTSYIPECLNGYTVSGNTCVKKTTSTPTKTCSSGYKLENGTCVATSSTSSALKTTYTCKTGKVSGSQCKVTRTSSTYVKEYTDHGQYWNGCEKKSVGIAACPGSHCNQKEYTYYCPSGSTYYTSATKSYACSSGYKQVGSGSTAKCYKIDASKLTTKCSTGTLSADKKSCTSTTTDSSKFDPTCPSGYTKNGKGYSTTCKKYEEYIVEARQTCPFGGTLNSSGYCVTTSTDVKAPTKKVDYYCAVGGYTLSGTTCYRTSENYKEPDVKTTYSCTEGILNGNKCVISSSSTKNPSVNTTYSCAEGKLNGTKCIVDYKETQSANVNTSYSCPSGYTKRGEGTNTTCTKGSVEIENAVRSSSNVTKYRYQWSEKTSIDGWTRTGRTRKIEASVK